MDISKMKIEMADTTVIESLEQYVDEILNVFAEVMRCPGIKNSFVSDRSSVWDFIGLNEDNDEENLKTISSKLGIEVSEKDYIYELAIKLRNKID